MRALAPEGRSFACGCAGTEFCKWLFRLRFRYRAARVWFHWRRSSASSRISFSTCSGSIPASGSLSPIEVMRDAACRIWAGRSSGRMLSETPSTTACSTTFSSSRTLPGACRNSRCRRCRTFGLTSSPRAASAIDTPDSKRRTASNLNSLLNFLRNIPRTQSSIR